MQAMENIVLEFILGGRNGRSNECIMYKWMNVPYPVDTGFSLRFSWSRPPRPPPRAPSNCVNLDNKEPLNIKGFN